MLISIFPVMADFLFNQYDDVEIPLKGGREDLFVL
jgi:hypothetical protein